MKEQPQKTYTEQFEEIFPYYLSLGMTYEEFWEGDVSLPKFYREAEKLRVKRACKDDNLHCWLQGLYVYEALNCALGNAFRKKNAQPITYPEKPLEIFKDEKREKENAEKEREKVSIKVQLQMSNWVKMFSHLPKG